MARRSDLESLPPVPCWYCFRPLPVERIVRDGIILGRDAAHGGPERLFICPSCLKENLCEETAKGRWFASPRISVGFLDLLFSKLPGVSSEEILQAISWFRENEERRRWFFLRDGDRRYVGKSILEMLWPWSGGAAGGRAGSPGGRPAGRKGTDRFRERAGAAGPSGSSGSRGAGNRSEDGSRSGDRRGGSAGSPAARPRIITPYEILGLSPGASADEVRKAFHRLAVRYHPDKVHHLGEEFRAMAHVKFQELKRAYDALTGD
jgi:DnaJ-domain-containing protein 1